MRCMYHYIVPRRAYLRDAHRRRRFNERQLNDVAIMDSQEYAMSGL